MATFGGYGVVVSVLGWYRGGNDDVEGVEVVQQHLEDVGGRRREVGRQWLRKGRGF